MSIRSLDIWKNTFAEMELAIDQTWKASWSDWMFDNSSFWIEEIENEPDVTHDGMVLSGYIPSENIQFSFSKTAFNSSMPDSSLITNFRSDLANAWEAGVLSSTLSISVPMTTPAFTAISSVLVEPSSISAGKSLINNVVLTPVLDATQSTFIPAVRSAFLGLTYAVSGTVGGSGTTLNNQVVE